VTGVLRGTRPGLIARRPSLRGLARGVLEQVVLRTGAAWLARRRRRGEALVLAYHNVLPDGAAPAGERTLHLSLRAFIRQVEWVTRTHEAVPLADVLTPAGGGHRPRVAITFDDAYRGAVVLAVDELVKRGVPATIFVAPALLGCDGFWWDRLAEPATGVVAPEARRHALEALGGSHEAVCAWAAQQGRPEPELPPFAKPATEDELRLAASRPGITLGSHSWSHPNLSRLGADELARELSRPLAWLHQRFPTVLPWLAYPYGIASAAVEAAARDGGYAAALLVAGGWLPPGRARRYALPRLNVAAGLSDGGFVLRTSGLLAGRQRTMEGG